MRYRAGLRADVVAPAAIVCHHGRGATDDYVIAPRAWSHLLTTNVVAVDERFVALLLTWDARQESPVHAHAGSSCFQ